MSNLSLNLLETDTEISNLIMKALEEDIAKFIKIVYDKTIKYIATEFKDMMLSSSIYSAIIGVGLKTELGLTDGGQRFINIVDTWIENMYKESTYNKNSFTIRVVRADYKDVIDIDAAIHSVYSKREKQMNHMPWLSWLLLSGSANVITGYSVQYGHPIQSRTQDAIMVKHGMFPIPSKYQGSSQDNFVTDILGRLSVEIESKIQTFAQETEI